MARLRLSATDAELIRLTSQADEAERALDALNEDRERAADAGRPGPTPADIARARQRVEAARGMVDAARRHASGRRSSRPRT